VSKVLQAPPLLEVLKERLALKVLPEFLVLQDLKV
jgi:hypothetical protein